MSVTTLELIVMLVSSHSMLMRVLLINLATFAFIEEVVWLIIVKVKVPTKMYIRRWKIASTHIISFPVSTLVVASIASLIVEARLTVAVHLVPILVYMQAAAAIHAPVVSLAESTFMLIFEVILLLVFTEPWIIVVATTYP